MPSNTRFRRYLVAIHYLVPAFLLFGGWLAFRRDDSRYLPTMVDIYFFCSGMLMLLVTMAFQLWQGIAFRQELDKYKRSLKSLGPAHGETPGSPWQATDEALSRQLAALLRENLAQRVAHLESVAGSPPMVSSPGREDFPVAVDSNELEDLSISDEVASSSDRPCVGEGRSSQKGVPVDPMRPPSGGGIRSAPSGRSLSDSEIIPMVEKMFVEACGNLNWDINDLVNFLATRLEEFGRDLRVTELSRDGAVAESRNYWKDAAQVSMPRGSVAVLFGEDKGLLFPSPLAGDENFADCKAFHSEIHAARMLRSRLQRCIAAHIREKSKGCYEVTKVGQLDFSI